MHANYLGLRGQKSGAAAGSSRYSRAASQASPSTRCQKCLGLGHYTADCTNKREYKVRPTRTQILKNPKLRTPLTESAPVRTEDMPKQVVPLLCSFSRAQPMSLTDLGQSFHEQGRNRRSHPRRQRSQEASQTRKRETGTGTRSVLSPPRQRLVFVRGIIQELVDRVVLLVLLGIEPKPQSE